MVNLVSRTQGVGSMEGSTIDEMVAYQARVSSPKSAQDKFKNISGLIRYCAINSHWSIFDTVNLGFEIQTSRAIGRQLLRHSSINPQEFSQRYEEVISFEGVELRKAHKSNRQSSSDRFDPNLYPSTFGDTSVKASAIVNDHLIQTANLYSALLENGVANEQARLILPECATSKLYMNGTLRSWITFLNVRLHETTQKEARMIAMEIALVLLEECPVISTAFYNFEAEGDIHFLERVVLEKYKVYDYVCNERLIDNVGI